MSQLQNMTLDNPFPSFSGFRYSPAIPFEPGVTRRDPSPVIQVGDLYHVWYSRSTEADHGFTATVWHATSPDGFAWTEQNETIGRGGAGRFDECGVFTPSILVAQGRYYLFYTAMPLAWREHPHTTKGAIGVAVADSPEGPWRKIGDGPVLQTGDNDTDFDSLRVDDTCFLVRDGKYWMYYKGRQMGRSYKETGMGLAIADAPAGPYVKHTASPLLNRGHEVCVWPHGAGFASLVSPYGAKNTLEWSDDGLHFRTIAQVEAPMAPGPFRADGFRDGAGPGITWGLCIQNHPQWPSLQRFECELQAPAR